MRQRRAPVPITARQIDTFRRELTQRECSPGTVENYIRSVRAFARWNREAPVTRGRAAEWRRSLAETHAPATVNAMLAGLSKFFTLTGREDCRVRPLRLQHRSFRSAELELSRAEYRSLVCTARAEGRERLALLMETVCIAILGTVVGGILALPISFLASPKIMPKPVAFIFNALILLIRTLPSIVWALIWIRVTGPGAFCGVIFWIIGLCTA